MSGQGGGLVLLGIDDPFTRIVHHALRDRFGDHPVLLEERIPRVDLLRRRAGRHGWSKAFGQALFVGLAMPALRYLARERIGEILAEGGCSTAPFTGPIHRVGTVNDEAALSLLRGWAPKVAVVNGTRILAPASLEAGARVGTLFLNLHAGITPAYRGVHGAYWALAEGRPDLAGVTLHYVDQGVDTGAIIAQRQVQVSAMDSFVTYPYVQLIAGLPLLLDAVGLLLGGREVPARPVDSTGTWVRTHPTVIQYVMTRLTRGIA